MGPSRTRFGEFGLYGTTPALSSGGVQGRAGLILDSPKVHIKVCPEKSVDTLWCEICFFWTNAKRGSHEYQCFSEGVYSAKVTSTAENRHPAHPGESLSAE